MPADRSSNDATHGQLQRSKLTRSSHDTLVLTAFFFALFVVFCFHLQLKILPVPSGFDELQHLSYAAALQERFTLLPPLGSMRVLDVVDLRRWSDEPNYHSHPAPFYLLAALLLDRSLPVEAALQQLRLFSLLVAASGVLLGLIGGLRQFGDVPGARVPFCVLVALAPQLVLGSAHFNNDALALLAGGLAYCAVTLPPGRPRGMALFVGVLLACVTKLSAGLTVGLWALCAAALLRAPGLIVIVVCAGALGALPYVAKIWAFGSPVPVTYETVHRAEQVAGPFVEALASFAGNFLLSWGYAGNGHSANAVALLALLGCFGWGVWMAASGRAPALSAAVAIAAAGAFASTFAIHLYFSMTSLAGSASAAQIRYYFPIWPMIAQAAVLPAIHASSRTTRISASVLLIGVVMGAGIGISK